ncbi:hypothetical protein C8R44DRAFT_984097 [Mycena epipterygia]|nr:hypothetical protein C8R44DRAFT_984097 [Mycena epipterygia]
MSSHYQRHDPLLLSTLPQLETLKAAIVDEPYCTGTHAVSGHDCVIWYGKNKYAPTRIDQNNVDVLDDSYRKAFKMDVGEFTAAFPIAARQNLIRDVEAQLLGPDQRTYSALDAKLYKVNVYDTL